MLRAYAAAAQAGLVPTVLTLLLLLLPLSPATEHRAPSRHGAWPLTPRPPVAHGFDPPRLRWGRGHRGVDLVGASGQSVRSALGGRVTFAGRIAGRGVVVVDHGGVRTTYEPVRSSVQIGDTVARGGRIGALQRGTSHCFPRACLHWGLLRGQSYLNPLTLVGAGPLRLLPLTLVARGRSGCSRSPRRGRPPDRGPPRPPGSGARVGQVVGLA